MLETVYFEAGSAIDKADRDLRHAAHLYDRSRPENKASAVEALRRAALVFSDVAKGLVMSGKTV